MLHPGRGEGVVTRMRDVTSWWGCCNQGVGCSNKGE